MQDHFSFGKVLIMDMTRITDISRIEYIYNTFMKKDFPRSELKPLAIIRRMHEQHLYECYQMAENDILIGYAFFAKLAAGSGYNYLLDYFAVVDGYRNKGHGSEFLKQLSAVITDAGCILAEVEDPDRAGDESTREMRWRRLGFYLRNGYVEAGVTAQVFGMTYRILECTSGPAHSSGEIRELYSSMYKYMIPPMMYKMNIRI